MSNDVTGEQEVINKLLRYLDKTIDRVADATERTGIAVEIHAKGEHVGIESHAKNRYKNVTSTLTRSIGNKLVISPSVITSIVFTNVKYGPDVEFGPRNGIGYPFMYPAIRANENNLRRRTKKAMKGK